MDTNMGNVDSLAGHLLVSMPGMPDPNFQNTVTMDDTCKA